MLSLASYVVARSSGLAKPKAATTGANGYGPTSSPGRYLVPLREIPANGALILAADKIVLVREPDGEGFLGCLHPPGVHGGPGSKRRDHMPMPRQRVQHPHRGRHPGAGKPPPAPGGRGRA